MIERADLAKIESFLGVTDGRDAMAIVDGGNDRLSIHYYSPAGGIEAHTSVPAPECPSFSQTIGVDAWRTTIRALLSLPFDTATVRRTKNGILEIAIKGSKLRLNHIAEGVLVPTYDPGDSIAAIEVNGANLRSIFTAARAAAADSDANPILQGIRITVPKKTKRVELESSDTYAVFFAHLAQDGARSYSSKDDSVSIVIPADIIARCAGLLDGETTRLDIRTGCIFLKDESTSIRILALAGSWPDLRGAVRKQKLPHRIPLRPEALSFMQNLASLNDRHIAEMSVAKNRLRIAATRDQIAQAEFVDMVEGPDISFGINADMLLAVGGENVELLYGDERSSMIQIKTDSQRWWFSVVR